MDRDTKLKIAGVIATMVKLQEVLPLMAEIAEGMIDLMIEAERGETAPDLIQKLETTLRRIAAAVDAAKKVDFDFNRLTTATDTGFGIVMAILAEKQAR